MSDVASFFDSSDDSDETPVSVLDDGSTDYNQDPTTSFFAPPDTSSNNGGLFSFLNNTVDTDQAYNAIVAQNQINNGDLLGLNTDPSESITPLSPTTSSPNAFSNLLRSFGNATASNQTTQNSQLGQLIGNLANRLIQPTGQGGVSIPLTNNLNNVSGGLGSLLTNPIVLIGGVILLFIILER